MRNPLAAPRFRVAPRPAPPAPLAIPAHLADADAGLLLVRAGPAGPDVTDLNHTAAALLGVEEVSLLGTLLVDCPPLGGTPGLVAVVDLVTRGTATWWRTVAHDADGRLLALTASSGPVRGSALLQLGGDGSTPAAWWAGTQSAAS